MPVRNEEGALEATLDDVLGQVVDVPFEVVAAEGGSSDRTREILEARQARDPRLRVVDNPHGGTPQALNCALRAARGRYLVRVDGHSRLPPNFVQALVDNLRAGRCEAVGGLMRAVGVGPFGRAVAAVHRSRFGVGNAKHHYASEPTFVDHVAFPGYLTDRVRALGGWDERFVRNQDFELDYRYLLAGNRILLDPSVSFDWNVRETVRAFGKQSYQYGWWKLRALVRHPSSLNLRWLVPPALLVVLTAGIVFSRTTPGQLLLVGAAGAYGVFLLAAATLIGREAGWRLVPRIALATATLHFTWAAGFLASAVTVVLGRLRARPPRRRETPTGSETA